MALIRRRLNNLSDALAMQQNEEELLRRRAALQQQQSQQLNNIIPQAVSGLSSFLDQQDQRAQRELDQQRKEEERIFNLASMVDVGEFNTEDQINKIAEEQAKREMQAQAQAKGPAVPTIVNQSVEPDVLPVAPPQQATPLNMPKKEVLPPPKSVADVVFDQAEREKRIKEQEAAKGPIQPNYQGVDLAPKSSKDILMGKGPNALGSGREIVERVNYVAPAIAEQVKAGQDQPQSVVPGVAIPDVAKNKKVIPVAEDAEINKPVDPAEAKIQADQAKRVAAPNGQGPKNVEDLRRVSLTQTYKPLSWKTTAQEEAKKQVDELFKSKQSNVFSQLLKFGQDTGRFEQTRAMAEKIALKNIREARSKIENNHFDKWNKLQDNVIQAAKAEEDIVLKQAQAQKALQPTSSYLRISGDKVKDLATGTAAIRQARVVTNAFNKLMKKGGDGFPPLAAKNAIVAKITAAGANTDSSSAGGGGGVGALGTGINASVSQSAGGRYVDPKAFAESIDKMTDLEMTQDQRQFMKNSILLAQAVGKKLEDGRMTDADLKFYLENLFDWNSPQSLNESFGTRMNDLFARYKEMYGSYTADNPNLAANFDPPEVLMSGFDFNWSPERFGYESESDWKAELDRQNKENYARLSRITAGVKSGADEARKYGLGRGNTIKSGVQEGIEIVKGQFSDKPKDDSRQSRSDRLRAGKKPSSNRIMPD